MSPFDRRPELIFLFRLAKDLGRMVHEIRRGMTTWELLLWGEFYKREYNETKKLHEKMKRGKK